MAGRLSRVIERTYSVTLNQVITGEGITGRFRTERSVRQGCPLSALLFLVYLENVEKRWVKMNQGGAVMGRVKTFFLKLVDNNGEFGRGVKVNAKEFGNF